MIEYTNDEILALFLEALVNHKFKNSSFNRRPFEPFHLYSDDYNPHNHIRVDYEMFKRYNPYPQCLIGTGPFPPNPCTACPHLKWVYTGEMPYPEFKQMKKDEGLGGYGCPNYTFRPRDPKDYPDYKAAIIIDTRLLKNDPTTILLSRGGLVLNYHLGYPVIMRTALWTYIMLHHLNHNKYDDRPGNHGLVLLPKHTGTHITIYHKQNKMLIREGELQILYNDLNSDLSRIATLRTEIIGYKQEIDNIIETVGNCTAATRIVNYMMSNYPDLDTLIPRG